MLTLGIETSCDDTAVALHHSARGILAESTWSQTIHALYGGVVPELASRAHLVDLPAVAKSVFESAQVSLSELNTIAYTRGPGLMGGLLVGASFANSLAESLGLGVLGVHHLEAHLWVTQLAHPQLEPPFLGLLISGGHTLLVYVKGLGDYVVLGETLDDAVGEMLDKSARLLELEAFNGRALSEMAFRGTPERFPLPRPMCKIRGLSFSFSGLKTAVREYASHSVKNDQDKADLCASIEQCMVEVLMQKMRWAHAAYPCHSWVMAGGVAANEPLRLSMNTLAQSLQTRLYIPPINWCTDNGAMIAYLGSRRKDEATARGLAPKARWSLGEQ